MSAAGRAGRLRNLTLVLEGNNPRFPWEPSATMLTYRLTGTTEDSGFPRRTPTSVRRDQPTVDPGWTRIFSRTTVRLEDGAALLTCGYTENGPVTGIRESGREVDTGEKQEIAEQRWLA